MKKRALRAAVLALGSSLLISAALLPTVISAGQSLNPSYLSEMPAPARILAEIKGKNPEDTLERQMGAFQALEKVVDDMAWGLEKRYLPTRATPDENRVKDMYGYAYADLWHKATNKEDHLYDHDRDLLNELINKFFPDHLRSLYFQSNGNAQQYYRAFLQKNYGANSGVEGGSAAASAAAQDDPEKLCAAKGLDPLSCMVQGMMGGVLKAVDAAQGPEKPGLRISGVYQAGNFRMILDHSFTAWVHCDDVFLLSSYEIARQNNQMLLRLRNGDEPITLSLAADGTTLLGPAAVAIHGNAPGGSRTVSTPGSSQEVTTTQQRTLTPLEAEQYPDAVQNGQTYTMNETTTSTEYTPGTTSTVPVYQPKTATCKIGQLAVQPAQPIEAQKKPTGLAALAAGMIPPSPFVPNGLRMAGSYDGQAGASIEFLADKAIVGCHATQAEHPYTVRVMAGQMVINLQGSGGPAMLALGSDATLRGDGAPLQINGHTTTGENAIGDPIYAASSDTCSYGSLAPRAAK